MRAEDELEKERERGRALEQGLGSFYIKYPLFSDPNDIFAVKAHRRPPEPKEQYSSWTLEAQDLGLVLTFLLCLLCASPC